MEESKQEQNKKRNRSLFIYVSLGLLIFFGVQRYNQTINAPENSTFSEFQTQINQGLVTEATSIFDLYFFSFLIASSDFLNPTIQYKVSLTYINRDLFLFLFCSCLLSSTF